MLVGYQLSNIGPLVSESLHFLFKFLLIAAVGCLIDLGLLLTGILRFDGPAWIFLLLFCGLWMNFAATLGVSFRWMRGRPFLAAVLGALGGSSTYYAGARLGALELHDNLALALGVIGIEWAIAMPVAIAAWWRLVPETDTP